MAGSHARKVAIKPNEVWRARIKASMIINRLEDHIDGKVELSASQVSAALGLLRKVVPDMAAIAVDHTGQVEHVLVTSVMPDVSTLLDTVEKRLQ